MYLIMAYHTPWKNIIVRNSNDKFKLRLQYGYSLKYRSIIKHFNRKKT